MGELTVAPCGHDAAKYAVTCWHYSEVMPAGKLLKHGVWESGRFTGAVIYGRGATPRLTGQFGLQQTECVELVRVALRDHQHHVSQIVADSLRQLHRTNPGLRLVVSFADPGQGHHGGIYQAGNWLYLGTGNPPPEYVIHGQRMHSRSVYAKGWSQSVPWLRANVDPNAQGLRLPGKHRYVMPLDKQTRRRVAKLAKPYPRAVEVSEATHTGPAGEGPVRSRATALTLSMEG